MPATAAERHIEIAKKLYDCLGRHEFDQLPDLFAEDVEAYFPYSLREGPPAPTVGRDKVVQNLRNGVPAVADRIDFHYDAFYPGEDQKSLVMDFHSTGVRAGNRGPYGNIYVVILRFEDGKIVLWKEYFDVIRGSGGVERFVRNAAKLTARASQRAERAE